MKVVLTAIVFVASGFTRIHGESPNPVVVHEWGTFTSVAGADGIAVGWAPFNGPADLPCFVYQGVSNLKYVLNGTVRMETPVLYFYAQRPVTLDVKVDFPEGQITEWYPKESAYSQKGVLNSAGQNKFQGSRMEWNNVQVRPGARLNFPLGKGASHYYAARATDSAPLRIGEQEEKLIFYRGIGSFAVPLQARMTEEGLVRIANSAMQPIPLAIVFENRGGTIGYRTVRDLKESVTLDLPEPTANLAELQRKLARELVQLGLYEMEAAAMIETWRDSWFEDGMRVFYIVPQKSVDAILPLTINPVPGSVKRVFVGRVEVLSPWTRQTIESAIRAGDTGTLSKLGRFLQPFADQMGAGKSPILARMRQELLQSYLSRACVE